MTTAKREKFSSQVDPELLAGMRKIATDDGRQFRVLKAFRRICRGRSTEESSPRGHGPCQG